MECKGYRGLQTVFDKRLLFFFGDQNIFHHLKRRSLEKVKVRKINIVAITF